MRDTFFICESLRHFKEVGTFFPTSKYTAEIMAREVIGKEVLEFGAGTGVITKKILENLTDNDRLTCFELNTEFCKRLENINDRRLRIKNEDACNFPNYVNSPDCIVSAIPLALMPEQEKRKLLELFTRAKKLIQIQYNCWSKPMYEGYFSNVKMKFSPFNLPPAFIYVCSNEH